MLSRVGSNKSGILLWCLNIFDCLSWRRRAHVILDQTSSKPLWQVHIGRMPILRHASRVLISLRVELNQAEAVQRLDFNFPSPQSER